MNYFNSDVDLGIGLPYGAMDMNTGFSGGNAYDNSFSSPSTSWSNMYNSGMLDKPFYSPSDDGGFSGGFSKNFDGALNFLKSKVAQEKEKEEDPYKPINLAGAGGGRTQALEGSHSMYIPGQQIATVIPAQQSSGGGGFLSTALKVGSFFAPPGVGKAMQVGSMLV